MVSILRRNSPRLGQSVSVDKFVQSQQVIKFLQCVKEDTTIVSWRSYCCYCTRKQVFFITFSLVNVNKSVYKFADTVITLLCTDRYLNKILFWTRSVFQIFILCLIDRVRNLMWKHETLQLKSDIFGWNLSAYFTNRLEKSIFFIERTRK